MFYNYKLIFFIIFYGICSVLYYFINKQIMLTGFIAGFLLGSLILYGVIILISFLTSLLAALFSKYCYIVGCGICKIKPGQMLPQTCWTIFTILSYAAAFIIFLKMIEY